MTDANPASQPQASHPEHLQVIQTYLVTFVSALLGISAGISTTVIVYSSLAAFITVPVVGMVSDRFGRRPTYIVVASIALVSIVPSMLMILSKETALVYLGFGLLHNLLVMALFSVENITICELFGPAVATRSTPWPERPPRSSPLVWDRLSSQRSSPRLQVRGSPWL